VFFHLHPSSYVVVVITSLSKKCDPITQNLINHRKQPKHLSTRKQSTMSQQPSSVECITLTSYSRCNGTYHIDTNALPPFVIHKEFHGGAVTELEWKEFCHVVNTKLQTINRLRCALMVVVASILIVLLTLLFAFLSVGYDKDTASFFDEHWWFEVLPD
jgi:hypothetical protein